LRNKDYQLRRNYGITIADYEAMFIKQGGRCAICRRKSRLTLHVEHSHITGTVRGLACMGCNRDVIGPLDGDPDRIQAAIDFLVRMKDDLERFQAGPQLPGPPVETNHQAHRPVHLPPIRQRPSPVLLRRM
jgi:recombination endonuclease VII